mmetsp:Transcript_30574/g.34872  ORF Transcript_30574/g.34872 Transcript_30574/m.34872 type:complete len:515 (+) Transcript_30574:31-1575(+)
MGNYKEPVWAQRPQHTWKLIEIKGGIELAHHNFEKACFLFGRAADIVDLALAHESCSRQHARIAFDARGFPWLRDLSSTHGTLVNKKQLPAEAIGKTESISREKGSRGVILFPGDTLQFGCSSRLYHLEGPSNFERGMVKALEQQKKSAEDRKAAHQEVSQMYDEDGTVPEEQKILDESSIPPQFQKIWETLKAKKYKQRNIETESERLVAKGELSIGQKTQLERNRQKLSSLNDEITEMEIDLKNKIYPGKRINQKRLFTAAVEDEDVEDRTQDRSTLQKDPETEETLVAKWNALHKIWVDQKKAGRVTEERLKRLTEKMLAVSDEEDRFFLQNEVNLNQDISNKIDREQTALISSIKETEKLLSVVNKKIVTNLEAGYIGLESLYPQCSSNDVSLPLTNGMTAPELLSSKPKRVLPPVPEFSKEDVQEKAPPITKRMRVHGPTKPSAANKAKPSQTMGTTEFMNNFSMPAPKNNNNKVLSTVCDTQKDEWQKPAGQDGSGRTKLNKKFEGRY